MKNLSNPNRLNLLFTKKYCSDINLLTQNIVDGLPGEYKYQLEMSVNRLVPLNTSLNEVQKTSLGRCKDKLEQNGERELGYRLGKVLAL